MTLRLWAAHQLLMKGWELAKNGTLGMHEVTNPFSTLFGTVPAPRVLQNQLDRFLEQYCAQKECECLLGLQTLFRGGEKSQLPIYTVIALLLNIRERDIWRLSSWIGDRNSVCIVHRKHSVMTLILAGVPVATSTVSKNPYQTERVL
jgi:hypothetical protein